MSLRKIFPIIIGLTFSVEAISGAGSHPRSRIRTWNKGNSKASFQKVFSDVQASLIRDPKSHCKISADSSATIQLAPVRGEELFQFQDPVSGEKGEWPIYGEDIVEMMQFAYKNFSSIKRKIDIEFQIDGSLNDCIISEEEVEGKTSINPDYFSYYPGSAAALIEIDKALDDKSVTRSKRSKKGIILRHVHARRTEIQTQYGYFSDTQYIDGKEYLVVYIDLGNYLSSVNSSRIKQFLLQ